MPVVAARDRTLRLAGSSGPANAGQRFAQIRCNGEADYTLTRHRDANTTAKLRRAFAGPFVARAAVAI
jgi:hypothetical protein